MVRSALAGILCSTALTSAAFALTCTNTGGQTVPPPSKSVTSANIGNDICNPYTGVITKVSAVKTDPAGVSNPQTAFVMTADGQVFLVKQVGDILYSDNGLTPMTITGINNSGTVPVYTVSSSAGSGTILGYMSQADYDTFSGASGGGAAPTTGSSLSNTEDGISHVVYGANGQNGKNAAWIFAPPTDGGNGSPGPDVNVALSGNVDTRDNPLAPAGVTVGSVGGNGGTGGSTTFAWWTAANGGTGGNGGNVTASWGLDPSGGVNSVTTRYDGQHGIYVFSISGLGGSAGNSTLGLGPGRGGNAANGGDVTFTNYGNVETFGTRSYGLLGQSFGNNGGNAGTQYGLVGVAGRGGDGGSGGIVTLTNNGSIVTHGEGSHGIVARSVGGSGGDASDNFNLLVSFGATGGKAGTGKDVTVTNNGSVTTSEKNARGIFAQSVGGGGGSAGTSWGLVSVGGLAEAGGDAAKVTVTNSATGVVTTYGVGSDAIFAQSVGGSGGGGGLSSGIVTLGGTAGEGGDGGAVTVTNAGVVTTAANHARGIVAQSVGGGGGDGGDTAGWVSIGGSGGKGGEGGAVTVYHSGEIKTKGEDSSAIFAQSVGGGGGNGGTAVSTGLVAASGIGGTGGKGGAGGVVTVNLGARAGGLPATIVTQEDRSYGIFAQSVGGGGGNGGRAQSYAVGVGQTSAFALGGTGGDGGTGGTVSITGVAGMQHVIETGGDDSSAIVMQSVGGGGGNGGNAVTVATTVLAGLTLNNSIGGTGGKGGAGGTVTMGDRTTAGFIGDIRTGGERSIGILAESVGGGGGNGGSSLSVTAGVTLASLELTNTIGGSGEKGGTGGQVIVNSQGSVTTAKDFSLGILAQSVGGGGGNGGDATSAGGTVSLASMKLNFSMGGEGATGSSGGNVTTITGDGTAAIADRGLIETGGSYSTGILAQSVGGGGGSGGSVVGAGLSVAATSVNVSAQMGGTGGGGGAGGTVDGQLYSHVLTKGDYSKGAVYQSVGGGGGTGGSSIVASGGVAGMSGSVSLGVGGRGGEASDGGQVDLVSAGNKIETMGAHSTGLLAQSVGGGGGAGGYSVVVDAGVALAGSGNSVSLGGSGGDGGSGGLVTASVATDFMTHGAGSTALIAQSIGGGGGTGGYTVAGAVQAGVAGAGISVGMGGSGGGAGNGQKVVTNYSGQINTFGDQSGGVLAQSVGGGGGAGGYNISGAIAAGAAGAVGGSVGLGGSGGGGGTGGKVELAFGWRGAATIATSGFSSAGVVAQSIGGGGGTGGFNVAGTITGGGIGAGAASFGMGGAGGTGNSAGAVDLTSNEDISVFTGVALPASIFDTLSPTAKARLGDSSIGILAQSVGGGGGAGGYNISATISGAGAGAAAASVGMGGNGGVGGSADAVTLDLRKHTNVETNGRGSAGVVAQSIGGGGGAGGFNVSASGVGAGGGAVGAAAGMGGTGGSGGEGGTVTASLTGTVETHKEDSTGILAQSVGGGGGSGGYNISANLTGAGGGALGAVAGMGGKGGSGNLGGEAHLTLGDGSGVRTWGGNSSGVIVQSIGGGGGAGGFNVSGTVAGAGGGSAAVSLGFGGDGGLGGNANIVTASIGSGLVETHGKNATGILAQSVGGGGGSGGFNIAASVTGGGAGAAAASVSMGGKGAGGGLGEMVTLNSAASVLTYGDNASGVVAQSVGGGGGSGGFSIAPTLSGAGGGAGAASVALGGNGGAGNNGGKVMATVDTGPAPTEGIATKGVNSVGILAQSVGGGGGSGGFAIAFSGAGAGGGSAAAAFSLGGAGAGGGAGDEVQLSALTQVWTEGDNSAGVVAQSIGGGGGSGGFAISGAAAGAGGGAAGFGMAMGGSAAEGGVAKLVSLTTGGEYLSTKGLNSVGILAQSVGGGGGNGGFSIAGSVAGAGGGAGAASLALGGGGGAGGAGGEVRLTAGNKTIVTGGDNSTAVLAQSIGGGGGNGGFSVAASIAGAGAGAGGVSASLGGKGGTGNDADIVTAKVTTGSGAGQGISTSGRNSTGILAQSIGGGGGNGGFSVAVSGAGAGTGAGAVSVGVGGGGGDGGLGRKVTLEAEAPVWTLGDNASGIVAQSIGGGGGNGGFNISGAVSGAGVGAGGLAIGLGGNGGAGGRAGEVDATVGGSIVSTAGVNSIGVLAQSIGGGGGNGGFNVSATIAGAGTGGVAASVGLGGNGASGGLAGKVGLTATHRTVVTKGENAAGIVAQSVGGGGGNGGFNVNAALAGGGTGAGAASVGLGGNGGAGNDAGIVIANIETGSSDDEGVWTFGRNATGILAQSIGGGGGNGGFTVDLAGAGGGTGAGAVAVGLGGSGGAAGTGKDVTLTADAKVGTGGEGASGIVAQSIGGGGGNGGFTVTASAAAGGTGAGALSLGLGGNGAGGGDAGNVSAKLGGGTIVTGGKNAMGVLAQSVGGGGGNGGFTVAATLTGGGTGSGAAAIGIGGQGGGGGKAGIVDLSVANQTVVTRGSDSSAIVAQSVGGGGGNGGMAVTASLAGGGTGAIAGSVGVGGSGGLASDGSAVTSHVISEQVETHGENSTGILTQSVGGGGGNGGMSISAAVAAAGTGAGSVGAAVGGTAGGGGDGGTVTATGTESETVLPVPARQTVLTFGKNAAGVVAQSLGGGGGNGGIAISAALSASGTGGGAVSVGVGGGGGDGGKGGAVSQKFTGAVGTEGEGAAGILAQSLGGGGGNGGMAISAGANLSAGNGGAIGVGVGGAGGGGGRSEDVDSVIRADVRTKGDRAGAVTAQSLGGGGGNGGMAITGTVSASARNGGALAVGVGGAGGGGGAAGRAALDHQGAVETRGEASRGLLAQSLGGGGGNGGMAISAAASLSMTNGGAIGVGVGGSGGGGGSAAEARLTGAGSVLTFGAQSDAVAAQSLGGGGGNGGLAVGGALSVAVSNGGAAGIGVGGSGGDGGAAGAAMLSYGGDVFTHGEASRGLLAQSLGGGGGNGGMSVGGAISISKSNGGGVGIGVGGSGGGGGAAALASLTGRGTVGTKGARADAVVAQSVGGGGGNGGMAVGAGLSLSMGNGVAAGIGVGGSGGDGGNGGETRLSYAGTVGTQGAAARGLFAQSLGGGGGNGGLAIGGAVSASVKNGGAIGIGVGGAGGGGGNGAAVTLEGSGAVGTLGEGSDAVVAQSLGGGGGNGGMSVAGGISLSKGNGGAVTVGVGGSGGDGGTGGAVRLGFDGDVGTRGEASRGLLAQSVGGGGGSGGMTVAGGISATMSNGGALALGVGGAGGKGGDAGAVDLDGKGSVGTEGGQADGVLAQSLGGGGGNGGMAVGGAISVALKNGGSVGIGVGGFGGEGGKAGQVKLAYSGAVGTEGKDARGLVAQSLGGGGGNGGLSVAGSMSFSVDKGGALALGVGGFGGKGGDAGDALAQVVADIVTEGAGADGVLVQSLGGGGGNGGMNVSGAISLTNPSKNTSQIASVAIGVGGFGGGAGNAGDAKLAFSGKVGAKAEDGGSASGLVVQSIGGGGGNGGMNISGGMSIAALSAGSDPNAPRAKSYGVVVGIGGFGGSAGHAGKVDVEVAKGSVIVANGAEASGIAASSIGGGGGNGAINISGGVASDATVVVGIGGMGAAGGRADTVKVVSDATIVVTGATDPEPEEEATTNALKEELAGLAQERADEILNTGGAAAMLIEAGMAAEEPLEVAGTAGILAQSLGGGGGNGGLNMSGAIQIAKSGKVPSITFGIGGMGGAAAASGAVSVDHRGQIAVTGDRKSGIIAQSLAGGGGNGGMNISATLGLGPTDPSKAPKKDMTIIAGIGGFGGAGADAGTVSVLSTGDISTEGTRARGILAQSIGGGGGDGGINVVGSRSSGSSPLALGIGGMGESGGNAGAVTVLRGAAGASAGLIMTDGEASSGIEASSIGGGGGSGGGNAVITVMKSGGVNPQEEKPSPATAALELLAPDLAAGMETVAGLVEKNDAAATEDGTTPPDPGTPQTKGPSRLAAQILIGGSGAGAGNGGMVDLGNHGDVLTLQANSHGLFAQSIGGGGGNAAQNIAVIDDQGASAKDNKSLQFALGGGTGAGGSGARVSLLHDGKIETRGDTSHGAFAQSVGGGGGNAASNTLESSGADARLALSLGRTGGSGGVAGDVVLGSRGSVLTRGDASHALFAQSVGGGGGNSTSISGSFTVPRGERGNFTVGLDIGLAGGVGSKGGAVAVNAAGQLATLGDRSHAIFAQSVGGGGGNGGSVSNTGGSQVVSMALGGTGGEGGIGGTVNVDSAAEIVTEGDGALGILAQSIGGGGGTGGSVGEEPEEALSEVASGDGESEVKTSVTLSIGGKGGAGMAGGAVGVANSGAISTEGLAAHGIKAQSVGGGGGSSGSVNTIVIAEDAASAKILSLALGGEGGTGAISGPVDVTNSGQIVTTGEDAVGIFAMAVGGGGGDALDVMNLTSVKSGQAQTLAFAMGGKGGVGGAGGAVTVANEKGALIATSGLRAHGIFAQSVGGGGGSGASTSVFSASGGNEPDAGGAPSGGPTLKNASMSLALGGDGGEGGVGGNVHVVNAGEIVTTGDNAHGIMAQSVGGGGGISGAALASDVPLADLESGPAAASRLGLGLGGDGGAGNVGGTVLVENTGRIVVKGRESHGIFAQSIGGGGGAAQAALDAMPAETVGSSLPNGAVPGGVSMALNLGGTGGKGGKGGDVTVNHSGEIVVAGASSYGILAQSVGGGGGAGSTRIASGAINPVDSSVRLDLGASGGEDNIGGEVTVNSTGRIVVLGEDSMAILNQAVSGGGGAAEAALVLPVDLPEPEAQTARGTAPVALAARGTVLAARPAAAPLAGGAMVLNTALGGANASGAFGRDVIASHKGDLLAVGGRSMGDLVQSVGGGGGLSRLALQDGGASALTLGGRLGGTGSSNAAGGAITAIRSGTLLARGGQSLGRVAQSIGGGGGVMVVGRTGTGTGAAAVTSRAALALGGAGGSGNDGKGIRLTLTGDTGTSGNLTGALVVQSIGAGGGTALMGGFDRLSAAIGGAAGARGNGGHIVLSNTGRVQAVGDNAQGIVVQSIGGGGGLVLSGLDRTGLNVTRRAGGQGDGGDIAFTQTGQVEAAGKQSVAILLQSLGGGGGVVDTVFRGAAGGAGKGGKISFTLTGNAFGDGADGIGIFAQSAGRDGADDIRLNVDGVVVGGSGAGTRSAGIVIDGGAANRLALSAKGLVFSRNDLAILGGSGDDIIASDGMLAGNIDMGGGTNKLLTSKLAYTRSMGVIDLGADGLFVNRGFLDPGGAVISSTRPVGAQPGSGNYGFQQNVVQTTAITGTLQMASDSRYLMDARFLASGAPGGKTSDLMTVSGDAAMGGTLLLRVSQLDRALPLSIILTKGIAANHGTQVADTVFVDYSVAVNAARPAGVAVPAGISTVDLIADARFSIDGMTRNQVQVGEHINAILNGDGSASLGPLFALLGNMTDRAQAIDAIDRLTAEGYATAKLVDWRNGLRFNRGLAMQIATPFAPDCRDGTCGWISHDKTNAKSPLGEGYDGKTAISTMGAQWESQEGARIGLAIGTEHGHFSGSPRFSGSYSADRYAVFGFMSRGSADFQGALSYGRSTLDAARLVGLSGVLPDGTKVALDSADADIKTRQVALNLGVAANQFSWDNGDYIRPLAEVDLAWLRQTGSESGLGPNGLKMDDKTRFMGALRVSAEFGRHVERADGSAYRAFMRAGLSYSLQDNAVTGMRFIGAPGSAPGFENFAPLPRSTVDVSLGWMGHNPNNGLFGEVRVDGSFADKTREVTGNLRLGVKF